MRLQRVERPVFAAALGQYCTLNPDFGAMITRPVPEDAVYYLTEDYASGFGVTLDGELVGLFNAADESRGDFLVRAATDTGAEYLNCFEVAPLVDLYHRHGFMIVGKDDWDPQLAPDGWNEDRFGTPPVVTMRLLSHDEL